ncbi:STAS-like domain-containing protein [Dinoroseobacter sp. S124A]|uniref:STAS-like domain-containing protein n=1 Tax=Dinoroseobacter sp. S124A TaxID=3415128 RepID=UPI003C7DACD9
MLSIANDFWPFPAGRVAADGPYNGEEFRKKHLLPALIAAEKAGAVLVVRLDGLKSCGSSFLESAFGGLVRYDGYTARNLQKLIRIDFNSASLERYKISIENHIKRAVAE